MAIVLDADVVTRDEKGSFDLAHWLTPRPNHQFEIAAITVAELWHGVERANGSHQGRRQQYLQTILDLIPVIAYTEQTAYHPSALNVS